VSTRKQRYVTSALVGTAFALWSTHYAVADCATRAIKEAMRLAGSSISVTYEAGL